MAFVATNPEEESFVVCLYTQRSNPTANTEKKAMIMMLLATRLQEEPDPLNGDRMSIVLAVFILGRKVGNLLFQRGVNFPPQVLWRFTSSLSLRRTEKTLKDSGRPASCFSYNRAASFNKFCANNNRCLSLMLHPPREIDNEMLTESGQAFHTGLIPRIRRRGRTETNRAGPAAG